MKVVGSIYTEMSGWSLRKTFESSGFALESLRYFRVLPNRPWADRFLTVEGVLPRWIRPVFTHYNAVFRNQG